MQNKYQKLITSLVKNRILLSEPLAKYTTFKIGGPADLFYKATTTAELVKAIILAKKYSIPFFLLGGGTNLLVADSGFRGLVIKNETSGIRLVGMKGKQMVGYDSQTVKTVFIEADCGVGLNRLVRFTLDQGLAGLEDFLGQPGSVGGAVYMNAHNMRLGKFVGDAVYSAKILKDSGEVAEVAASYFQFGYDKSMLSKTGEIVLSAVFRLTTGDKNRLWEKASETLKYRESTQPKGIYSSGCAFRNISKSEAVRLATPDYTCSTGYLLDKAGLKNYSVGKARFSMEHANIIVHSGGASASDVLELISTAKQRVKKKFGINLTEEIILVGDF